MQQNMDQFSATSDAVAVAINVTFNPLPKMMT